MKKPVYLDYNATTPVDREVANEMMPFINENFGNPSSTYSIGRFTKNAIDNARNQVASLIGCLPEEVFFTSGGTESNNLAIRGVATGKYKGNHIITSAIEHPSVTNVCDYLENSGFEITHVDTDEFGTVNLDEMEKAIRHDTILISVMHANNEIGTVQPINEISALAKKHNILVHTDAAQSVGKIKTDVSLLGVDLLSIAGHKLYAPKGIGALYIRKGVKTENLMFGGNQERGIRPGTENVIHIVALGKACEIVGRDLEKNKKAMSTAKELLFKGLGSIPGVRMHLNGKLTETLPNTLSVSFDGVEAHELTTLVEDEVFISAGAACHSGSTELSAVLKAIGADLKTAAGTVRISTGKYTTKDETDHAIRIISDAVRNLLPDNDNREN